MVILIGPYGPLGEYLAFHLTISHVVLPMGFEIWYFYWFSYQPDDRWDCTLQTCSLFFLSRFLNSCTVFALLVLLGSAFHMSTTLWLKKFRRSSNLESWPSRLCPPTAALVLCGLFSIVVNQVVLSTSSSGLHSLCMLYLDLSFPGGWLYNK